MGITAPRSTAQLVDFHPALGRRVISSFTAAQMKQMMESVVLRGTGTKAILNGYTSAGKTGTAQKIDPATGSYSRTDYIASFTGFAPVNNPAVVILVVLDSPVGPHEGAQVAAPVWNRIAQQVLAYLNVSHDIEVLEPKEFQLRAKARKEDLIEGSPDHLNNVEAGQMAPPPPAQAPKADVKPVAETSKCGTATCESPQKSCGTAAPGCGSSQASDPAPTSTKETVVLDVAGGVQVPDFSGKPLRTALEEAEEAGIELEVSGSGIAQTQSPAAGSHIPPGGRVSVKFGR